MRVPVSTPNDVRFSFLDAVAVAFAEAVTVIKACADAELVAVAEVLADHGHKLPSPGRYAALSGAFAQHAALKQA